MENIRQIQCKALGELEKIRRRKNNEEQWKKQCAEQWKQSEIGKKPADEQRRVIVAEIRD
jgi:DNA-binding TFAR19-related protein (PDSD5 family)